MVWEVEVTDEFESWWDGLTIDQQESLTDRVQSSRHHNMKELRASKDRALRVLFMFDPRRQVILLIGGDKSGEWNAWYEVAVPVADDLYDKYIDELRHEGLI